MYMWCIMQVVESVLVMHYLGAMLVVDNLVYLWCIMVVLGCFWMMCVFSDGFMFRGE